MLYFRCYYFNHYKNNHICSFKLTFDVLFVISFYFLNKYYELTVVVFSVVRTWFFSVNFGGLFEIPGFCVVGCLFWSFVFGSSNSDAVGRFSLVWDFMAIFASTSEFVLDCFFSVFKGLHRINLQVCLLTTARRIFTSCLAKSAGSKTSKTLKIY